MIRPAISHYKILENIGKGGMGAVCETEEMNLKRAAAFKFLRPEFTRANETANH
jgi:serine/threonine protein kinase